MKKLLFTVLLLAAFSVYAETPSEKLPDKMIHKGCMSTGSKPCKPQTFPLKNLPRGWSGYVEAEECEQGKCTGKGKIRLNANGRNYTFDAAFFESEPAKNPPLDIKDFNFDGKPDIAVYNGNSGPYGSAAPDIYVQTQSGKLVMSEELTDLGMSYMFTDIDKRRKLITAYGKSGAAVHFDDHFRVVPGKGLQQVYGRVIEHLATGKIKVEERWLRQGKWRKRVRILTEKEFERLYPEW